MNLNSRLFDRIRVKPAEDPQAQPAERTCDHPGCGLRGEFRAPKGRFREGQFYFFCLDHVRAYNQSYNYFAGMADDAVADYQKASLTGHRPTWKMGVNSAAQATQPGSGVPPRDPVYEDPFGVFGIGGFDPRRRSKPPEEAKPSVGNVARKAFEALGIEPGTPAAEIKARYKELVKRMHPDANGGDRSREDRLREIIRAYKLLRSTGLV